MRLGQKLNRRRLTYLERAVKSVGLTLVIALKRIINSDAITAMIPLATVYWFAPVVINELIKNPNGH